jgi:hypothetical protein
MEEIYFTDQLIQAGFAVEYWDLSNLFFPDINFGWELERDYVIKVRDYREFEEMIAARDRNRCRFIVGIIFNGLTIKLHRILTRHNCYLIFFARIGIPTFSPHDALLKKVVKNYHNYLRPGKIKEKFLNIVNQLYNNIGLTKHYDAVFAAGHIQESRYRGVSKVIPINFYDYDRYLCVKDNPSRLIPYDYCVFLDDNLAYDIDFVAFTIKTVTAKLYYQSLCAFFDRLENLFKVRIVIAAHPKAEYHGNEFGDRAIIQGKTNELVKDCHFAITSYSASTSYAILYKKPIVFIYTNELIDFVSCQTIKSFANMLDASIFNIDKIHHDDDLLQANISKINHSKYEDFKYNYLTSKSTENKLSGDIFMEFLTSLHNSLRIE